MNKDDFVETISLLYFILYAPHGKRFVHIRPS